ncbi:MAG: hypothetical protein HKN47_08540 [Pirellulaceae bacterium]|nr:hypothetical protein [Pirellulaceae bacterium]
MKPIPGDDLTNDEPNSDRDVDASPSDLSTAGGADDGPGWMPAILAGTLLLGVIGFVTCGFTTWMLFQKRTELVIRTLRATYIPSVEQSFIQPEEKKATLKHLDQFVDDLERGKYENWQAGGVMTRLIRLPVFQWGDLAAVEAYVQNDPSGFPDNAAKEFSRLRRATELNDATSIDFDYVLESVLVRDDSLRGQRLMDPLTVESVNDVIERAKEVADRLGVKDQQYTDIWIDKIVLREIDAGIADGSL